jgi:hypothetical protein
VIASGTVTDAVFNILIHTAVQTSVRAGERLGRKLNCAYQQEKIDYNSYNLVREDDESMNQFSGRQT